MERINFDELIAQLDDPTRQYGPQAQPLTILGGACLSNALLDFLTAWKLPKDDMPYCLWEEASRIVLAEMTPPRAPKWLERGRIFGPGGDLSLRRDGEAFNWWFIGPAGVTAPVGYDAVQDFWSDKHHKDLILHRHDDTSLLWGTWAGQDKDGRDFWWEDRVAGATLTYPGVSGQAERVHVQFWSFTVAGQLTFVWLRGLEAYNG